MKFWKGAAAKSCNIQLPVEFFFISCSFRSVLYQQISLLQLSRTFIHHGIQHLKKYFCHEFSFFNGSKCIKCFLSKCPSLLSLSWVSLRKSFIKKALVVAHLFASPVLLTKFGLSVSSIRSPGLIENLTFWPCDFQNISQLAIYSLDFTLAKEPETERKFEVELLYGILHLKIHFYFMLNKIRFLLGNPCVPEYKLLTVQTFNTLAKLQTEKIHDWHNWKAQLIYLDNNVNLILNITDVFFFQTAAEDLRCCLTSLTMQEESARQCGNGKVLDLIYIYSLQNSKLVNYNGANIVDVWNANKITDARTKMEVGKLRTRVAKWLCQCHQTKWGQM